MTTLKYEEIVRIAEEEAAANNIPVQAVTATATLDSFGWPAIEVTISIVPDASLDFIRDGRSSHVVSEVIRKVADEGEERLPVVHFERARAP
jgi:hypothetical protein